MNLDFYVTVKKIVRHSEKNGTIRAYKRGAWRVTVDGCQQTGPELHRMWVDALNRLKIYLGLQKVKKVLLLGLGAGGEIATYYRLFPRAEITVIEYDPEMIALTKELQLYKPYPLPHVICDDVRNAVPELRGTFDLIVVDLFQGARTSPLLEDATFLTDLNAKLAHDGYMLVNAYLHQVAFSKMSEVFQRLNSWKFKENHLALFQAAALKHALEAGYRPVREWRDYDGIAAIPPFFSPTHVGKDGAGSYWRLGPVSFEHYKSEVEPDIQPLPEKLRAPLRIIMWQRMTRMDVPKPWISFSNRPAWKIGFVPLLSEYHSSWSESARRARKAWKSGIEEQYSIEQITWDEFERALRKSTLPYTMRGSACFEIEMRMKNTQTEVVLVGARRKSDRRIVAGLARMYSKRAPLSYYMNGFYLKDVANEPVMVGLFGHFFEEALTRGVRFLDLGNFWKAGDDSSWKGFSVFKGKFSPLYFFFPATVYQFRFFEK